MAQTRPAPARNADTSVLSTITIELTSDLLAVIEYGASRRGVDLNEFLVASAVAAADDEICAIRPMRLSREESLQLIEMLDNPPEPNEALQRALANSREYFDE